MFANTLPENLSRGPPPPLPLLRTPFLILNAFFFQCGWFRLTRVFFFFYRSFRYHRGNVGQDHVGNFWGVTAQERNQKLAAFYGFVFWGKIVEEWRDSQHHLYTMHTHTHSNTIAKIIIIIKTSTPRERERERNTRGAKKTTTKREEGGGREWQFFLLFFFYSAVLTVKQGRRIVQQQTMIRIHFYLPHDVDVTFFMGFLRVVVVVKRIISLTVVALFFFELTILWCTKLVASYIFNI